MLLHPTQWALKMWTVVVFCYLMCHCLHSLNVLWTRLRNNSAESKACNVWQTLRLYFSFKSKCRLLFMLLHISCFFHLSPLRAGQTSYFSRHAFLLVLTGMLVRTWPRICVMVSESIFVNMLCMKLFWLPCSLMDVNLSFLQGNREEGRSCVCMELLCWGQGTENGWSSATLFSA